MSDADFLAGCVWFGAVWALGIAAWLWDARRMRVGSTECTEGGLSVVRANTPGGHTCSVLAGGSRALLEGASAPAPGPHCDAGNAAGPSRRDSRERPALSDAVRSGGKVRS
jgi:hypothetical protein